MRQRWIVAIAALAAAVPSFFLVWRSRTPAPSALEQSAASAAATERALRAELEAARREIGRLRAEADEAAGEDEPRQAKAAAKPSAASASTERDAQLEALREAAASAQQQIAEWKEKLAQAEARIAQVEQQQAESKASETALREQLEAAISKAAVMEGDRLTLSARLSQLEKANAELRRRQDDSARRLAQLRKLADDLEDLARRRESYLNSILGRYREATDLFRSLSLRLDSLREGTAAGGNELSRIQNAVSLADEDLRQLRALNVRAGALQKDLQAAAAGR